MFNQRGVKGIVVNRTLPFLHGVLLEITLTVPLIYLIFSVVRSCLLASNLNDAGTEYPRFFFPSGTLYWIHLVKCFDNRGLKS